MVLLGTYNTVSLMDHKKTIIITFSEILWLKSEIKASQKLIKNGTDFQNTQLI